MSLIVLIRFFGGALFHSIVFPRNKERLFSFSSARHTFQADSVLETGCGAVGGEVFEVPGFCFLFLGLELDEDLSFDHHCVSAFWFSRLKLLVLPSLLL